MALVRIYEHDNSKTRISTSVPYNKVKAIPELGLPALHRAHSAGASSIASTSPSATDSEKRGRAGVPVHEPCFVTKRPGYSLVKARLMAVASKDTAMKKAVESLLWYFHIVEGDFTLNSASNMIPLDRTLHYALDRLGLIAITCSEATLSAMLQLVEAENKKYDEFDGQYVRRFKFSDALFAKPEYEMVVLHPDHFLPLGSTITMHTRDPDDATHLTGKSYMMAEDGALREGRARTSQRFSAFSASDSRNGDTHWVNPFLVVLNADVAFRRFRRGNFTLCPDYQKLVDLTTQLADAIYHPSVVKAVSNMWVGLLPSGQSGGGSRDKGDSTHDNKGKGKDRATSWATAPKSQPRHSAGGISRKQETARLSRFGIEIKPPKPNASYEEVRDFCRYIISGRDNPLDAHDETILKTIGLYSVDSDENDEGAEHDNDVEAT